MGRNRKAQETAAPPPLTAWLPLGLWLLTFLALAVVPDQKILRYKLLAVETGVAALLAVLSASWAARSRSEWLRTPLDVPVALYAAGGLLFYALSPEKGPSQLELTRILFCAATFFAASQTVPRIRGFRALVAGWTALAALLGLYCLMQVRGGFWIIAVPQLSRPIATFGNPIFMAAFLASSLAAALGLLRASSGRSRILCAAASALIAAGLWTTQSRAAVAGLGAAAFLAVLVSLRGRRRWAALGLVALSGIAAVWWFRGRQWTHGLIWRDTLSLWLSHPWLGVGLGRFHIEFPAYASEALRRLWPQRQVIVNFAHNEYLQVLAETGVLGLALLLNVFLASWTWAFKGWSVLQDGAEKRLAGGLALAAAVLAGQNLFSPDIRFGLSSFILFFCLGAAAGRTSSVPVPIPPAGRALAAASTALFLILWGSMASAPLLAQRRLAAQPGFHIRSTERLRQVIHGYEMRLAADPSDADAAENLGYLYAKLKEWPRAVSRFEVAARLDPSRPGPLNNLGNICYSLGDRGRAVAYWEKSLEVQPDQLDAHLNLGKTLYESGRLKESARHLERVLELDPSNEKARILLKKMIE